jgi:hypothetical protein
LELLHARGVDSSPWLDPPSDVVVEATGGERYRVGFELDPVEVLRMGEPFGTCLAPGDVNFFSAVANAVDINKRLIYARDRRGVIVGRCLLALTESGHILTFRVYQNAQGFDFQAVIREMVNGLATRMGTHVVRRGRVPTLVATNWYDDGPHDLCGRFGCLADESPFRNSLLSIPLPELMDAVRLAFEPFAVDELTLPLLLELDEFQKRPELILPLLPLLDGDAHLLEQTCWQAAALAHRAGRSDFALQLLNRRAYPRLIRAVRNHGVCPCCSEPVLRTLAEADPSIALRILRATRSKRVRSDEEEFDGRRRALLITAHERLGRAELASRLKKVDTS